MDVPGFCDLAVGKAINGRPCNRNPIARGADAHQFAFVGATSHPARCYPVSLSYHILDLNVDVGEGRAVHASELLEAFAAVPLLGHGRIVVNVVFRDDFVYHIQVACAEDLLKRSSCDGLVLFGHSLCAPFSPTFPGGLAIPLTMTTNNKAVKGKVAFLGNRARSANFLEEFFSETEVAAGGSQYSGSLLLVVPACRSTRRTKKYETPRASTNTASTANS